MLIRARMPLHALLTLTPRVRAARARAHAACAVRIGCAARAHAARPCPPAFTPTPPNSLPLSLHARAPPARTALVLTARPRARPLY